jgi:phage shock protein C
VNGRRLYRSAHERVLGGVAGGVAEYFDLDPALVRVAWAVLIFGTAGIFLLLYLVMWVVVPEAPPGLDQGQPWTRPASVGAPEAGTRDAPAPSASAPPGGPPPAAPPPSIANDWAARRAARRRHRSGEGGILVGAVLILIGAWFLARDYLPWLRLAEFWPVALILIGVILLFCALRPRID